MKVEFAFQCGVHWDDMDGGDRVRHCERCQHAVYDLSQMTRSQAREFLERSNGELCVSFMCDAEGEVVTKPERPVRGVRGKLSAAVLTLPLLLAGCKSDEAQAVAHATATTAPSEPAPPTSSVEVEEAAPVPSEALTAVGAAVRTANESAEAECDRPRKVLQGTPPTPSWKRFAGKPMPERRNDDQMDRLRADEQPESHGGF